MNPQTTIPICNRTRKSITQLRKYAVLFSFTLCVLMATPICSFGTDSTYTVNKVNSTKNGSFEIEFAKDGTPQKAEISVEQGDGTDEIAKKIQQAIGNNATVKGNKVTFGGNSHGSGAHLIKNDFVTLTANDDLFDSCTGKEACPSAGIMSFAPNPDNGQDTLVSNTLVTAGFANGLSPVSFEAPTGENIYDLTLSLNSALDDAGYATDLLDSTDIVVFSDGSLDPTEMDLTLSSDDPVGDQGIMYGIDTPAPEGSSLLLFGSGLLSFGAFVRKRLLAVN